MRTIAALAMIFCTGAARAGPTLCAREEIAVFSCAIGQKIAALCASKDLDETTGTLFYRFGKPGAAELSYPGAGADPHKAFTISTIPPGNGDFVRFSNAGTTYTVYSLVTKIPGKFFSDGVLISKGSKVLADLHCKEEALVSGAAWGPVYKAKLPQAESTDLRPDGVFPRLQ